jgi:hypothetical protein
MKNTLVIIVSFLMSIGFTKAQLYSSQTVELSFFSKTPVEDIQAKSLKGLCVMNITTRELAFSVGNITFDFPNKLMEEHFNEKYMETEKFPNSTFKGKVNEQVDLSQNGEYKVTVTGKLNIHGVEQERTIPGIITVKDGVISVQCVFKVKVADHKITIPTLVVAKIAEEIEVKVNASLLPKK